MSSQFINVGGKEFPYEPGAGGICFCADQIKQPDGTFKIEFTKYWFGLQGRHVFMQNSRSGYTALQTTEQFLRTYGESEAAAIELRAQALRNVVINLDEERARVERRLAELEQAVSNTVQKELF